MRIFLWSTKVSLNKGTLNWNQCYNLICTNILCCCGMWQCGLLTWFFSETDVTSVDTIGSNWIKIVLFYFFNIPIEIRFLFNKISWENNIENQNCIGGWWRRLRVYSFFNKIQHLMDGQRYNRYMVKYNRNNLILFTLIENYVLWTRLYKNPINSRCVIICHPYDEPLLQVDRTQWPDLTSY